MYLLVRADAVLCCPCRQTSTSFPILNSGVPLRSPYSIRSQGGVLGGRCTELRLARHDVVLGRQMVVLVYTLVSAAGSLTNPMQDAYWASSTLLSPPRSRTVISRVASDRSHKSARGCESCGEPARQTKKDTKAFGKTPRAGWCVGMHRPPKPAQSGYRGLDGRPYCKACYRQRSPERYEAMKQARKHKCGDCGLVKDLVGGICRPCKRARGCELCDDINIDCHAQPCSRCSSWRLALGACSRRLVLWCTSCTTLEERQAERCRRCFEHMQGCS